MPRRPDPARIAIAREEALRARLRSAGHPPARVDGWLEGWTAAAATRGLDRRDRRFWEEAEAWLRERGA